MLHCLNTPLLLQPAEYSVLENLVKPSYEAGTTLLLLLVVCTVVGTSNLKMQVLTREASCQLSQAEAKSMTNVTAFTHTS